MPLFFDTGADTFSRRCWSSAFQITSPILYRPLISECFRRCLWIRIQHLKSFRGKQKELTPSAEVSLSFAILLTPSTFNRSTIPQIPTHRPQIPSRKHEQPLAQSREQPSSQSHHYLLFVQQFITTFVVQTQELRSDKEATEYRIEPLITTQSCSLFYQEIPFSLRCIRNASVLFYNGGEPP